MKKFKGILLDVTFAVFIMLAVTSCEKNEVYTPEWDVTENVDYLYNSLVKAYSIHYAGETISYYVVLPNGIKTYNTDGIWRCFNQNIVPTDCSNIN